MIRGTPLAKGRPSLLYQAGLAMVAVAMVILPCLYVLLTVLAGYGVYYFATHYFAAIWDWPLGNSRYGVLAKAFCSVTPLFVGSTVALFMVKPLFARRSARMQPLALNPDVEPEVYATVHAICDIVGAPAPRRIE